MLDVYFTIDVEVWCGGWHDLDRSFPGAFRRYVYGPDGDYGLPYQLRILTDHGLKAVCFVEPLFAGRFGPAPLAEIVGLIEGTEHETQLHLHTEWVDEINDPAFPRIDCKRQNLRDFTAAEQSTLLSIGIDWLLHAGAPRPTAFRAGSFGFNADTLTALAGNGIFLDSSYNATQFGPSSGVCPGELLYLPKQVGPILELPLTVYDDGFSLRHVQLTACAGLEIEHLLWKALETGHGSFVILSHNFELLTEGARSVDRTVVKRLRSLCEFLMRNSDCFRVCGLRDRTPELSGGPCLKSSILRTSVRMAEQAWRRVRQ